MQRRRLGNTDPNGTLLGYGTMDLRHVDQVEPTRLLNAAIDGARSQRQGAR